MDSTQSSNTKSDSGIPTVARVAQDTIIELVYDSDKRKTGLAVSRHGGLWNVEQEVRIHTGETLVPYSAKNNLIAHDCVLLPSKPEHHGDKAELLGDIEAFLHRYVDLSPLFERIAAHYILLTWVHDAFNELPYLRLRGDYGTGKLSPILRQRGIDRLADISHAGPFRRHADLGRSRFPVQRRDQRDRENPQQRQRKGYARPAHDAEPGQGI
jgi:hypothetical protein